jgi:thiol:disulfide interchange protein
MLKLPRIVFATCACLTIAFASSVTAQLPPLKKTNNRPVSPIKGLESLGGFNNNAGPKVEMSARFFVDAEGSRHGTLEITCAVGSGNHIYSLTQKPGGPRKSVLKLVPSPQYELVGEFVPTVKPKIIPPDVFPVESEKHIGQVTWLAAIRLAEGADPRTVQISGKIDGQVCTEAGACMQLSQFDPSFSASFAGVKPVTPPANSATSLAPPATNAAPLGQAKPAGAAEKPSPSPSGVAVAAPAGAGAAVGGLPKYLALGFLGGLILNLMPCVLPVIGLKIMSFAQQAGESSSRILWLNVCFVAGLITVFMGLAALAAFAGWGWGAQFQRPEFAIALALIVFVFALSFLGIWEIPIPGFVGSGSAAKAAQKEGPAGAFAKGVLTTLLATPCSGPLIVPTLAWAVTQPKPSIFAVFFSMGLGMGAPFLLIGLSPGLMKFLPKPGAWMETFKEVMGFILLATVLWVFTFLDKDYFVPTLALLFASWAACWWVGRIPLTAELGDKLRGYLVGIVFAGVLGFVAFSTLGPKPGAPQWAEFSPETLASLRDSGTTVLVDFTADW